MDIKTIGVEEWLNVWEKSATWDIAQSTISSLTMDELRALDEQDGATFYERLDREKMNYGWIEGSPEFKAEVAKLYRREVNPDHILQTNGWQFEHLTQIIQWCSPSLFLRTRLRVRRPGASGYVYACAGDTPLDAYTPCMRKKHLHGVIDCMVEVWISPVTFLLTLINRSNYSISIALRHRIYTLHIAGIPNADASVT